MKKIIFLRHIKSTFYACVLLLSCGMCLAQNSTNIAQGELRLDGSVTSFNAATGDLTLNAESFTVASGKSSDINPAKSKSILINAQTQVVDANGKAAAKSALKNGIEIAVIGIDGGSGKSLTARVVILLNAISSATTPTPKVTNKSGLQAGEYLLNGQVKGVFSAETIIVTIYKRTDAQGKVEELGRPMEQKIHLSGNTKIISAEDAKKTLTVGDIKLGQRIAVVGKYGGEEDPFNAREMVLRKEEEHDLQAAGSVSVHPLVAQLLRQGRDAYHAGSFPEALQFDLKASQMAESVGDIIGNSVAQNSLGLTYDAMNQPKLALAAYQASINYANSKGDQISAAIAMDNLGGHYLSNADFANAVKSYDAALAWTESLNFSGKEQMKESIYFNKAIALEISGQIDKAIPTMQMALNSSRQLSDVEMQAQSNVHLATLNFRTDHTNEAINNAHQAAELLPQVKDKSEQAILWSEVYIILKSAGDSQADGAYTNATQLYTELKNQEKLDRLSEVKTELEIVAESKTEIAKSKKLINEADEMIKAMQKLHEPSKTPPK